MELNSPDKTKRVHMGLPRTISISEEIITTHLDCLINFENSNNIHVNCIFMIKLRVNYTYTHN